MRILAVTDQRLASLSNGSNLRVWHLCRELARRHEMYLLTIPLGFPNKSNDGPIQLDDVFKKIDDLPYLFTHKPSLKGRFRLTQSSYYLLSYPRHFSIVTKAIAEVCEQNII